MGQLIDGVWHEDDRAARERNGRFVRSDSRFRRFITNDGSGEFPAASGRYHLYVSLACPWAHRSLIYRALYGLEEAVSVSIVDPLMAEGGWHFSDGPGCVPDTVNGTAFLHEVYTLAQPDYTGRVTVPTLWDRQAQTIVSNESSEIIRMFAEAMGAFHAAGAPDLRPAPLRDEIDAVNERVYRDVNNGVYKCGFARTQEAYDEAFAALSDTLDWLEGRLSASRYLCGDSPTEADWRLFPTLLRFDPVYVGHFKCNLRRIADYPCLSNYLRDLYQVPGVAGTCDIRHIKEHYYRSHTSLNPSGIVPRGPEISLDGRHRRGNFGHE